MRPKYSFAILFTGWCINLSSLSYSTGVGIGVGTITYPIEDTTQRSQNTKYWKTATGGYFEKGDNLCYNSSTTRTPNWQLVEESFSESTDPNYEYSAEQGVYQIKVKSNLSSLTPITYQINHKSISLGVKYLAYLDRSSGTYIKITTLTSSPTPNTAIANQLYYSNIFPNIDADYVYTRSKFEQNILINSISGLPSPSSLGLNASSTYLMIGTQVNWTTSSVELVTNGEVYSGSVLSAQDLPIDINDSSTHQWLASFAPSNANDNNGTTQKMYKELVREGSIDYLYEGVPYLWIISASLPVTLDYQIAGIGSSNNDTWLSGITYYLSTTYTVNGVLTIQPGAIVKVGQTNELAAESGGTIIAQGSPYNYILFTSWKDNSVGDSITTGTTPAIGNYTRAILLDTGSSSSSIVQYCKIYYASEGIFNNVGLTNPIENNIIRYCGDGIYLYKVSTCSIINNLITDCNNDAGIYATDTYNGNALVIARNNTFNNCYSAVNLSQAWFADFSNNLISSCGTALVDNWDGNLGYISGTHDYNTFYGNGANYYGASQSSNEIAVSTTQPLYTISSNGSFYLNPLVYGCIDRGNTTAQALGLDSKTVRAPLNVASISASAVWTPVMRDRGTVDIGYHYDPVDVVVGDASHLDIGISGTLTIKPGVVIAFWRDASNKTADLNCGDPANIIARGGVQSPIRFTSLWATNDQMNHPLGTGDTCAYNYALYITSTNDSTEIRNCIFQYANDGIYYIRSTPLVNPIRDNVFTNCQTGIYIIPAGDNPSSVNIQNNLILSPTNGGTGIYAFNSKGYILNNTINGNANASTGLYLSSLSNLTVGYNIVTNFPNGYSVKGSSNSSNAVLLYNTFFNYSAKSTGGMTESYSQMTDPQFASKGSGEFDNYYLAQTTGDASLFAMQQYSLTNIYEYIQDGNLIGYPDYVGVYATDQSGSLGSPIGSSSLNSFSSGTPASQSANLLIQIEDAGDGLVLSAGDYLTLTFGNGQTLKCYLPAMSIENASLYLWVAMDGSTYYGDRANGLLGYGVTPNQDALSAMVNNTAHIAANSFSNSGQSPCVDYCSTYSYNSVNLQYGSTRTDGLRDGRIDKSGYLLDGGYHYPSFVTLSISNGGSFPGNSNTLLGSDLCNGPALVYMTWPKAVVDDSTGHILYSDSDLTGYSGFTAFDPGVSHPLAVLNITDSTLWYLGGTEDTYYSPSTNHPDHMYGVVLNSITTTLTEGNGCSNSGEPYICIKTVGPNRLYIDNVETDVLDRGKYAAAGATGYAYSTTSTNVMQLYGLMTTASVGLPWIGAGLFTEPTSTNLASFIQNAGSNDTNNGEASLLYISTGKSYGESTNIVINAASGTSSYFYAPGSGNTPTLNTGNWTQGVKWVMSESENMLGNSGNPTAYLSYWANALLPASDSTIPHMILGSWLGSFAHDPVSISGVLSTFFYNATNGSVADAWVIDVNNLGAYGTKPFAALMHYDNQYDTLVQPTPDSADPTMLYLYWNSAAISTTFVSWNLPIVNPADYRLASLGKGILQKYPPKPYLVPEEISDRQIKKELFDSIAHLDGFLKLERKTSNNNVALQMSDIEAERLAKTTLRKQGGGVPQDMQLVGVNNLKMGLFNAEHINETYKEFTKVKQLTFAHVKDGQQIYANGKPDYIKVSIDAKGVQSIERQWHKLVMR